MSKLGETVWEYKTYLYNSNNTPIEIVKHLNIIGELGWEMVSTVPDKNYVRVFFKREKEDDNE